ncbi:MAG: flagellar hook-length control protein FliK [Gammaproteobacteria bacterium]|nr:flagellar hook-length control protein FliK [Gammaproteobacteria bacterium]
MINIPPIRPSSEIKTALIPDVTKTWKIGQLLNATAETGGDAMSKVILRLGQYTLETKTPVPLKPGEQLTLLVKELGTPPLLSIQAPASNEQTIAAKLRSFIAQQQSIQTLTNLIGTLANNDSNKLPKEIRQLIQQLVSQIPVKEQVTKPSPLKQAIQNNGIFLEPKLARSTADRIEPDLKSQLLKISAGLDTIQKEAAIKLPLDKAFETGTKQLDKLDIAIKQFTDGKIDIKQLAQQLLTLLPKNELLTLQKILSVPASTIPEKTISSILLQLVSHIKQQPQNQQKQLSETLLALLKNTPLLQELKTLVDSVLAKITSQQLTPLLRDADNLLLLLFDLPVRHKDETTVFNFKIEQDNKADTGEKNSWTAIINFNFKSIGPVQAKIHLIDNNVSTVFYAEETSTIELIKRNASLLEKAFNQAGLAVINIDVSKEAPADNNLGTPRIHLLDEQA